MDERREKYSGGLIPEFLAYSSEVIKGTVTLPFRIPTYAIRLKESLADPEQRRSGIQNGILTMLGVISFGGLTVMGIQDPEIGKKLLLAASVSFVLSLPAAFWTVKASQKSRP